MMRLSYIELQGLNNHTTIHDIVNQIHLVVYLFQVHSSRLFEPKFPYRTNLKIVLHMIIRMS